jgi:NADPH2:quinone reductase
MKAWRVHAWGEPESMVLDEVEAPAAGPGEVRIRNHAAALNFFDILQVQGKYQIKPPFPFIPGAEVAGLVDAIGDGVIGRQTGDRVMAISRGNGFADYSIVKASNVFPLPPEMTFAEAAAIPIAYHTSYFALHHRARLRAGETLLVHAGASGVGMAAIQIGKALGARVLATAGSAPKRTFSLAQGADAAFDYCDLGWVESVLTATDGRGADVIYDPVGGDVFDQSTKCIASEGRLAVIGFASGRVPTMAANRVLLKNISLVGVLWGGYLQAHPEYSGTVHAALMEMYRHEQVRPAVGANCPFEQAPRGLRDLANRKVMGKSVLTIGS